MKLIISHIKTLAMCEISFDVFTREKLPLITIKVILAQLHIYDLLI